MNRRRLPSRFKGWLSVAVLLVAACDQSHYVEPIEVAAPRTDSGANDERDAAADAARDATTSDASDVMTGAPGGDDEDAGADGDSRSCAQQFDESLDGIPDELRCTGLYQDIRRKLVAQGVLPYAPAVPLWSDGSGKQRWIALPADTVIDATDPDEWQFPVGTKFFKEFRANGRRVETRLYEKLNEDRWVRATFVWNEDETAATRSFGADLEDVTLYGEAYHVPNGRECDQCHGGRKDRILGFSAVSLGLPGATGITLQSLATQGLLEPVPTRQRLSIGDDGTGLAAPALGWLHINCGVTCHNDYQNAEAYSSGLRLKIFARELDGRPPVDFELLQTTVDVPAKTNRFGDATRIVPGSPETSLLYQLLSSRASEREQMPPIATRVVDIHNTQIVEDWIRAMPVD